MTPGFLAENVKWLFDGVGGVIVVGLVGWLVKRWASSRHAQVESPREHDLPRDQQARRTFSLPSVGGRHPHSGFELLPINFEAVLGPGVPRIEASFYAVNYMKSQLVLRSAVIESLSCGDGLRVYNIFPITEFKLPPTSAHFVFFRKELTDAEARAAAPVATVLGATSGSYSLRARAHDGEREIEYGPIAGQGISGRVVGTLDTRGAGAAP